MTWCSRLATAMGQAPDTAHVFSTDTIRFVCISDTHDDDCRSHVPDGDVLLHAGDLTNFGTLEELQTAVDWIISFPHAVKVMVAGTSSLSPLQSGEKTTSHIPPSPPNLDDYATQTATTTANTEGENPTGNHDLSLDENYPSFTPSALKILTSHKALASNLYYLDREVRTVATYLDRTGG